MEEGEKTKLRLEIAHVLFIDIVGYSKLLIDEQSEVLQELNAMVRKTETARAAEAAGELIFLPTGDGMALVFTGSVEDPVECALQISQALRAQPSLPVRMGIHSGPVHHVADVNNRENIAGAGINTAQRVMDCGDAGHILVSKRVADDLVQYRRWQPYLHDLGDFEVKHGVVVSVVNLYADVVGNAERPSKFKQGKLRTTASGQAKRSPLLIVLVVVGLMLFCLAVLGIIFAPAILKMVGIPQRREAVRSGAAEEGGRRSAASLPILEKSIAVLPFENLSSDKENAFFADGVQDEILTHLANIADLKVISRTSVMQYKTGAQRNLREIGQQLGVARVVEGSVQRAANKVRVNAQLIDARNDAHLWAQTYDRDLADVFAIQSEIAKAIADQLQAKLSPREKAAIEKRPTADVTAFDLYSRAKTLLLTTSFSALAKPNLLQAVDLLNQALARDPSFFLAQCQQAFAHVNLYHLGIDHTPARLAQAEAAVQAAFRLQPDAGEAHLAQAEHRYRGYLDYEGALAELEIARRTLPNDPRVFELTGYIARRQGRQEEALRSLERAVELDPRNFFTLQQIALSYVNLRRYSDEAAVLNRALSITPDDVETKVVRALVDLDEKANTRPLHETIAAIQAKEPATLQRVADTWLLCALAERDVAAAEAALATLGDTPLGNDAILFSPSFSEGIVARLAKNEKKARSAFVAAREQQEKIVQAQSDYGPAVCMLGVIDAALGRKEEALREGQRAVELLPVAKDSINGVHMIEYLAMIAAWVGDKDLACERLAIAVKLPGTLSYGQLKLLPYWDPLRGDPRFEKTVASLAPK
jgi:TolB-like protein/class 3 adenylate cyclase/Tfp pilus assembly protein PilF